MFDYLVKNKEWIFSGVGIAIFTVVPSFIYWLYRWRTAQITIGKNVENKVEFTEVSGPVSRSNHPIPAHITQLSPISFQEIYASLDVVPPFQKETLARSYEGIYIRWNTHLHSASPFGKDKDEVYVSLNVDGFKNHQWVFCVVKLAEYKELGVMQKGTPISIIGKIKEIDGLSIKLALRVTEWVKE